MRELNEQLPIHPFRRLLVAFNSALTNPVTAEQVAAPAVAAGSVAALTYDFPRRALVRRGKGAPRESALAWAARYRRNLRITDTLLVLLSVVGSLGIVSALVPLTISRAIIVIAGIFTVWLAALWLGKTRDMRLIGVGVGEYKKVIQASAAAFGWLAVLFLVNQAQGMAVLFLVAMPMGTAALLAGRWGWRLWLTKQRKYGHYLSRVIVLGSYEDVNYVVDQIAKKSGPAYLVVGAALENPEDAPDGIVGRNLVPVVAGLDNITEAVTECGADAVIVAGHVGRGNSYVRELGWKLEDSSTELVVALSLTNVAGPRIQIRPVEGLPLMHVDLPQFSGYKHLLKRGMDILVSGLALLFLLPVFAVLGFLIKRDSRGPVIFRQERVCRDGKTFEMYKFRSMVETAEEELELLLSGNEGSGPLFKLRNDPRVTKVGSWMRRYSLDELPQFINVFKGQMSLVGPRPPLPSEVAGYDGHAHRRLYIKPGVTGLWQINGRSDLSWEESVRLDLYYVENWSLPGDLMIMWRTLKVMIRPTGAY